MKSQLLDYQGSPGSDFFIVGMLCLCCSYFPDNRFCIRTLVFHTQFVFSLMQFEGTGGFEAGHCNEYLLSLWYFLLFSHVWVFVTPWTAACQAFLSFTTFQSLLRLMSVESVMPSNHLILCHTFFSCLQSFLASWSFPMSRFFASGGQYFGASASVLLLNAAAAKSLQSCLTLRPDRRQPTRLPRPWDSPGKNTGVGCHFLLQCMRVKSESEATQSCPTLSVLMDRSLPGSSVHGIFQARVLEWGAIAFSVFHWIFTAYFL